jgi:hypothetical protein
MILDVFFPKSYHVFFTGKNLFQNSVRFLAIPENLDAYFDKIGLKIAWKNSAGERI